MTIGTEFHHPPADPIALLRDWFDRAVDNGVREPGAVALATVAADGRPSTRMIQTSTLTDRGLVFTSHTVSQKGREIAATGWGSGVLYWRETNQQIILTGRIEQLPDSEADALWAARAPAALPMSVATRQSQPLTDEAALLAEATRLAESGQPLPRPRTWVAYHLVPSTLEFWQSSPDRLYRRLRYDRNGSGWTTVRLQP
ncbi:MAG TPA: phenazine biosynthesis FMN-dependent oxidase PhzG [Actinophytocola sp.]|uniref:phenazine biosynthesis FMN-dependent oxidase PhzG n=1 Tax=Actinophytocola sp. TaxID=1872138 RepID=UPI002DDD31B1|nr:phenazine biosynthesis FMN-dependent oxidase PhzG [Actinophytocola sp.]HEV2783952.1 phenazine biosynthesis FMN-dependent oxidase PhzG [Actinophytocola sp.]